MFTSNQNITVWHVWHVFRIFLFGLECQGNERINEYEIGIRKNSFMKYIYNKMITDCTYKCIKIPISILHECTQVPAFHTLETFRLKSVTFCTFRLQKR